jgi:hypothetical protein
MALTVNPSDEGQKLLDALEGFGPILAMKLYRLGRGPGPNVPILPCLDHEAMLHEGIAPHAAAYVQERASGDLHELVIVPAEHRIEIDTVSTFGEHSPESLARLAALLTTKMAAYRIEVKRPTWWRGERRVATACHAQVSLRDVLLASDLDAVRRQVDRLALVGTLMEKHSRVASWGIRTIMSPFLAATGVLLYVLIGALKPGSEDWVAVLRYALLAVLGGWFLYYGMKAVQLTDMGNRVWKKSAEYALILAERKRLGP